MFALGGAAARVAWARVGAGPTGSLIVDPGCEHGPAQRRSGCLNAADDLASGMPRPPMASGRWKGLEKPGPPRAAAAPLESDPRTGPDEAGFLVTTEAAERISAPHEVQATTPRGARRTSSGPVDAPHRRRSVNRPDPLRWAFEATTGEPGGCAVMQPAPATIIRLQG